MELACGTVSNWLAYRYLVPAGESQFGVEEEMIFAKVKLHSCTQVLLDCSERFRKEDRCR